jgi:hypothetical protein
MNEQDPHYTSPLFYVNEKRGKLKKAVNLYNIGIPDKSDNRIHQKKFR